MLYEQFAKPAGLVGKAVGWFMNKENEELNQWTVSFLGVEEGDSVLEVGFGAGQTLCTIANRQEGKVFGVDPSEVMVDTSIKRLQKRNSDCDICMIQGEASVLEGFREPLDKVYAINNVTYWDQPVATLTHLRSLLRKGGKIALTIRPHEDGAGDQTTEVLGDQLRALLANAGFKQIEVFIKSAHPNNAVCAVATNQ
ncbi:methyltransferase domain-containing protein [Halobacillus locisalis]|uniref:Methyltransferase domain-containing protein n=1 Tax=Halobacillus locisalis TaxID=220753 RepID=A0A838CYC6_9BACI|nr:methyltransferase domain-containing protein [Halobacillus locisalis]MBA2176765.1 methyltransferase domain-containing protein [Halobacillus locisalis]